jgi:hypothetical protein
MLLPAAFYRREGLADPREWMGLLQPVGNLAGRKRSIEREAVIDTAVDPHNLIGVYVVYAGRLFGFEPVNKGLHVDTNKKRALGHVPLTRIYSHFKIIDYSSHFGQLLQQPSNVVVVVSGWKQFSVLYVPAPPWYNSFRMARSPVLEDCFRGGFHKGRARKA